MAAAWNLLFGVPDGLAQVPVRTAALQHRSPRDARPVPDTPPSGWTGTAGPGIAWRHWPRHPETGLPLCHILTLWLPREYRRAGQEYPGIAFFSAGGESLLDAEYPAQLGPGFAADLAAAEPHPRWERRVDALDCEHGFLWLTEAELAAGPTPPAADPRLPSERRTELESRGEGFLSAWDTPWGRDDIWLVERDDPNAGVAPQDRWANPSNGYADPYVGAPDWVAPLQGFSHLGGTTFHAQDLPDGLTPWFLELEEFGPLNFGGGCLQMDLESDAFDWAC